ncbi:hypothetical protein [Nannocystis pusilla]|uniref:hypothetical protein n=1 Tax=Nannocystis pusilla TaxID=889268 RepID=UPI003DA20483
MLLGLLADERIPNAEALALSPTVGWWMLLGFVFFVSACIFHREAFRRLFLRAEDPRTMGLFRIVFGLVTLFNINGLSDLFIYLFTDEGLFLTNVAREVFAKEQFVGFGDGIDPEPYGFFDWGGVVEWLKGPKYSPLFFWDSPSAFWLVLGAFEVACVCMIVGFKTNITKWVTLLLFHSIILRNQVFWEGTENVYRCFLLYLCMSRCGAAYSVDNWLRCRRLRKQGRLSERDGPGAGAGVAPSAEHPQGLEAVYRLIPAWPRMIMILQLAALYCSTGTVKNGDIWAKGDAFYYALNLDHFYRFEPQQLSAVFGTNLFRLNTIVTHYWEAFFPLVVLGLVVRFVRREQLPPLPEWQRWAVRACWLGLGLVGLVVVYITLPFHIPAQPRAGMAGLATWQRWFPVVWLAGMAVVGGLFYWLGRRPPSVTIRGRRLTLDLDWFCTWFLGRRLWLGLGLIFHAHLIVMMNIGWFTPATMATYIAFLNGSEVAFLLRAIGERLGRVGLPVPKDITRGDAPLPAEDPSLPHLHRDAAALPAWALWGALAVAVGGVYVAAETDLGVPWAATGAVIFAGLAVVGFGVAQRRGAEQLPVIDPHSGRARRPWAYGSMGRFLAGAFVVYHCTGVAIWLLPEKDSLGGEGKDGWRVRAQDPFKWWIRTSQTAQGWKMFAPNPPRSNIFMQVMVTDHEGNAFDLNTDVYHPANKPIPWLGYTRQRKINRRIIGGEGGKGEWYQKWHARWVCRDWALKHGGQAPKKVELYKLSYTIPTPEEVAKSGPYKPEERLAANRFRKLVYTGECTDINAQLPNTIRARHGLPLLAPGEFRPWVKNHLSAWNKKKPRSPQIPWIVLVSVIVVGAAGLRWRQLDRDNKRRALAEKT